MNIHREATLMMVRQLMNPTQETNAEVQQIFLMNFVFCRVESLQVAGFTRISLVMLWLRLHIKALPVLEPRKTIFTKYEWDVAISWQLRGLHGCYEV